MLNTIIGKVSTLSATQGDSMRGEKRNTKRNAKKVMGGEEDLRGWMLNTYMVK